MAVDVDYYSVLGVARDADKDTIETAVKKAMREWRKRTEAADLSVRQEAEVKVKHIEAARATLLSANNRAAYDRELAGGVKETKPTRIDSGNGQSWLDRAEGFLAVGDYQSASYAAREATHVEGTDARTWWVRSRANAGLDLWQDALYEARQATTLEDNNGDYQFNLGAIQEQMGSFGDAINSYRKAGTCDPTNFLYELAVAGVYATNGKPEEALPIAEAVYAKHKDDETANYYLGQILIDSAEKIPRRKDTDSYWVTSQDEIDRMRTLARRAKDLRVPDADVTAAAKQMLQYLDKMEEKALRPPRKLLARAIGGADGFGELLVRIMFAGAVIFAPLILVIIGFGVIANNPGAGVLCLLAGGGLGYLWFRLSWIPRWKHNLKDIG